MSKLRVYELAKELGLDNKEVMAKLRTLKIQIKTSMSYLAEEEVEKIRKAFAETENVVSAGGMEEKRVGKSVIRRRTKPSAAVPEPVEESPKMELGVLKTSKRVRREDETHAKPEPEILEGLPKEWEQEEELKPKKKTAKKKAAAGAAEAPGPAPSPLPAAGLGPRRAGPRGPARAPREGAKILPLAPRETAAPAGPAAPETKPRPLPLKRKIYMRPVLRKTARAVEGQPLPIPGQAPAAKAGEVVQLETEDSKKKKKKKKGREETAAPVEVFEEAPKKKLRRKIAFKVQRGMEGMEMADVEKMYMPSRKKMTGKKKPSRKTQITTPRAAKRIVKMGEKITVIELARQLEVKLHEVVKALMAEGVMAAENQALDLDDRDRHRRDL